MQFMDSLWGMVPARGRELGKVYWAGIAGFQASAVVLVFILAFGSGFVRAALVGWPDPAVHDEFSYLLQADTFSQGRLANPAHPLARHFETLHVLQHPVYVSKYQPFSGLVFALGDFLGHPGIGISLLCAVAVAAVFWSLRLLLGTFAAAAGTFFAWFVLSPFSLYGSNYLGAASPVLGSALVLGAGVKILRNTDTPGRCAFFFTLGAGVLAFSRPYEGLVLVLGWLGILAVHFFRTPAGACRLAALLPPWAGFSAGLLFLIAAYNSSVMGEPWKFAYLAYEDTHSSYPVFLFQEPREKKLALSDPLERYDKEYTGWRYWKQRGRSLSERLGECFQVARMAVLPLPWLMLPFLCFCGRKYAKWVLLCSGLIILILAAAAVTLWYYEQYAGVIFPLAFLWQAAGIRWMSAYFWGRLYVFFAMAVVAGISLLLVGMSPGADSPQQKFVRFRSGIEAKLLGEAGSDLVLVSYQGDYDLHFQNWVYNKADIDRAEIVWAHDCGPQGNIELLAHFIERKVWHLRISGDAVVLEDGNAERVSF
jgi:hypothetical protein